MNVIPGQFVPAAANAREIFKACVAHVHIEVSTYCNRVCGFCTNATYDRRTKKYMKEELFFRILEDLKSIDYSHELCLWRYNEMLADRDFILERIRQCVAYLPNAKVWVVTNGDYLDKQYILDLIDAGVRRMWVNIYLQEDAEYTMLAMLNQMSKRLNAFDVPYEFELVDPNIIKAIARPTRDFEIEVYARNLHVIGHGRLGKIEGGKPYERVSPCASVFDFFEIEHDGTVLPCCNIRGDISDHAGYVVGKVSQETSIFDVYLSENLVGWRRDLLSFGKKKAPCDICYDRLIPETPENVARLNGMARDFGLLEAEPA
jgi:hypothetical protein